MKTKFEDVYQELVNRNCVVKVTKANNLQVKCDDGTLLTFCQSGYIRRKQARYNCGPRFQWLFTSKKYAYSNGQKWTYRAMIDKINRTPEMLKGAN
jgi:hypothetical protein